MKKFIPIILILFFSFSAYAWQDPAKFTAYDPTASGLGVYNVQAAIDNIVATPAGSFRMPPNMVLVDPAGAVVAGESYQTWTAADAYVATQSPSITNPWGIKITGTNAENI
ncbi:MAG: hypothetical protein GY869_26710, partial [Planctomycetes bacterium]|nr:hypothetical protein [Planctomycetota bacterium]